ncbi:MAG: glycogen/starch/alpha-glucan phosphorylase [Pseudomonadota bacterium]
MNPSELAVVTLDDDNLPYDILRHYCLTLGQDVDRLSRDYLYQALALALRDRLVGRWKSTKRERQGKQAFYLSMEFLMGRALTNAAHALNLNEPLNAFLLEYGLALEAMTGEEVDAGLGNGGLGRLAACFLDSCATLELPVTGYGIRYEYGMFQQRIEHNEQVEYPDHWLMHGNPWEMVRLEDTRRIRFGGHTTGRQGQRWIDTDDVLAIPYDLMIPGHNTMTVNRLRLWKAAATDEFDLSEFQSGSYPEAVAAKNTAENITMVLYPNDVSENGKALRLRQQYFLTSASLQDVIADWVEREGANFNHFAATHVFQLNDTHPATAVPELMRILLDDHQLPWDQAWEITTASMAYTNHTLLPEALESWPVPLFEELLPRLLEIIFEINARFLQEVASRWPGDTDRLRRMSIIEEGPTRRVRMAYLAIVGSFSINGVAALHSRLLTEQLFQDFFDLWPMRFNNKTNGVTPRRWLAHANPKLANLLDDSIGTDWRTNLEALAKLQQLAGDTTFQERWRDVKHANKERLCRDIKRRMNLSLEPGWLLDVQVKRIHEYKRQLLNILHVIHLYDRIHRGEGDHLVPRTVLFGGKAAPGYQQAKLIISLISRVADAVNRDLRVNQQLRVLFLPNYDVTAMELICPATELSEQISTAGKEASGTGNMKLMMNGAITIGTLDGANIEILERVGEENFFAFGLEAHEVASRRFHYDPAAIISQDEDLRRVLALIDADHFSLFSQGQFAGITGSIRSPQDPWMVAADFRSYINTQAAVESAYRDTARWQQMSIRNTAASGWFSSDRTIREYASDIWHLWVPATTQKAPEDR